MAQTFLPSARLVFDLSHAEKNFSILRPLLGSSGILRVWSRLLDDVEARFQQAMDVAELFTLSWAVE